MTIDHIRDMRIAVLLGGTSPERDVSLMSGETVQRALAEAGAQVVPVDTAERGWWEQLAGVELAFNVLHGGEGENGVVQGALETLSVP